MTRKIKMQFEEGSGWFWEQGNDSGGYYDTEAEAQEDYDHHWDNDTDPECILGVYCGQDKPS